MEMYKENGFNGCLCDLLPWERLISIYCCVFIVIFSIEFLKASYFELIFHIK